MSSATQMSSAIKMSIDAKMSDLANAKAALQSYTEQMNYNISQMEHEIYQLNINLQLAEAEETFVPSPIAAEAEDDPCYYCGRAEYACICVEHVEEELPIREERTKLKWVQDKENYRVAVVTKNGIVEVKNVEGGMGYVHDCETCACTPCSEINLSKRLGVPNPPWTRIPLAKTFYHSERAWRDSLPVGGEVTVTAPHISDLALKKLCMKPLENTSDALKLKELEKRFPGATMVLSTKKKQLEIEYMGVDQLNKQRIYSRTTGEIRKNFSDFEFATAKPQLMAEWRNMYIDLSHLF